MSQLEREMRAVLRERLDSCTVTLHSLQIEVGRLTTAAESSNADDEHDPEGATLAFERQLLVAQLDQAAAAADEARLALGRLDAGTYGTCEGCGAPIAGQRLQARPWARTCISCAA